MSSGEMKELWDQLHTHARFRPKYPSEAVVRFIFNYFRRDNTEKVLDLGCGAGRHVRLIASEGVNAYGCDLSAEGIESTKKMLETYGLKADLKVSAVDKLEYEDEYFDGLVCYGVLYYCRSREIQKSAEEIYRVLKCGGKAFIAVRNIKDFRYGHGKEIEKNTFLIHESNPNTIFYNENGMTVHFFDKYEIEDIFKSFSNVSVVDEVYYDEDGTIYTSNSYIYLTK